MTKDIENFFMCLFGIRVFSLVKYLFASFTHLKNQVVSHIIEFKKISSGYEFFVRYIVYKYFLPLCGFPLFFLEKSILKIKVFDLMKSNFFFFPLCCYLWQFQGSLPLFPFSHRPQSCPFWYPMSKYHCFMYFLWFSIIYRGETFPWHFILHWRKMKS